MCNIIPEAACDKIILAHFPCNQGEVDARENQPNTEKGILKRVSVSILKFVSNFKEAIKKFINCIGKCKAFERP